jgi:hypothetical protein
MVRKFLYSSLVMLFVPLCTSSCFRVVPVNTTANNEASGGGDNPTQSCTQLEACSIKADLKVDNLSMLMQYTYLRSYIASLKGGNVVDSEDQKDAIQSANTKISEVAAYFRPLFITWLNNDLIKDDKKKILLLSYPDLIAEIFVVSCQVTSNVDTFKITIAGAINRARKKADPAFEFKTFADILCPIVTHPDFAVGCPVTADFNDLILRCNK